MHLDATLRDLLTEIGELAGRFGHGAVERPRHDLEALALFDRCRSTFGAIRLLLEHDFAQEAVILGRPLFTESLMLAEFAAANETRRIELVIGWSLEGLGNLEGIVKEAAARGDDASEELQDIARQRDELKGYARRHGASTLHWKPDEKRLADAHGRGQEYIDFRLTHHFVHGSTMAVSHRYSKTDDETVAVGGPAAEVETWSAPAGLFAAFSMLHASRAACRIFGWSEPPKLQALLQRLDEACEAL